MMSSKELRAKAWASLKGKYWQAFAVSLVMSMLVSAGSGALSGAQSLLEIIHVVDSYEMDATMKLGATVIMIIGAVLFIVGLLLAIFVGNAASVGLVKYYIKNTDGTPTFTDAFYGFKVKYGRNIGTILLMGIKLFLWCCLFVIPGIIKSYEYAIVPYILADDAEISSKDAFKKAREMMMGNKWRLFKLSLSFFGWGVLCVLTLGVGALFLAPYTSAAAAEFYVELKNKQNA